MDNQTFFTLVTRMDSTLGHLDKAVTILAAEVKELQRRQNYWAGAVAAIGVGSSAVGAVAALVLQWVLSK